MDPTLRMDEMRLRPLMSDRRYTTTSAVMRVRLPILLSLFLLCSLHMQAWAVTGPSSAQTPDAANNSADNSASTIDLRSIPIAQPVPAAPTGVPVTIRAHEQNRQGDLYTLRGEVEINYKSYILRADTMTYDAATGDVHADGHVQLNGGPDNEEISASHGELNLNTQVGTFYDVFGSIGVMRGTEQRAVYTTPNPFLFTARRLVKSGPATYALYGGSVTSCRIPKPHWQLFAPHIAVKGDVAKAWNSNFRLLGYPVFYLPYVTHPVSAAGRQSGFFIPVLSTSNIKGIIIGDSYYWAINRSSDMMIGLQYYSLRGWEVNAQYRLRGRGNDFLRGAYNGLVDRGFGPKHIDQGGQDTVVVGRYDFDEKTRAVVDAEYLSSYVYRQVFAPNFALAVSSEVKSWAFLTHQRDGMTFATDFERYQNFVSDNTDDEVRILHLPRLDFGINDRNLGHTRLLAGGDTSFSIATRYEPELTDNLTAARTDFHPHLSLPWLKGGWTFRPEIGLRDTFYSNRQTLSSAIPVQHNASLNRTAAEASMEVRAPVLERDFNGEGLARNFGVALRHTIAPELHYRFIGGVDNFNDVERFDTVDIYSDTNEAEYGITQRLFVKPVRPRPCPSKDTSAAVQGDSSISQPCPGQTQEWLTWYVGQKYFFDPTFGGAVIAGRRNVFATTLDLSSIAYVTVARPLSPVVSRLRMRTSGTTDVEWDLEYDTKAGRVAASNVFANYRYGQFFSSFGSALMNAPAETIVAAGKHVPVENFNQMQMLFGYGAATKPGLSAAANGGLDVNLHSLEYAGMQTSYNFDCCGFSVKYRRFALGSVRNENQYSFSFTLAGVGAAGTLKRAERLF